MRHFYLGGIFTAVFSFVIMSGCAQPKLDRAQFVALDDATQRAMTRTYEGFTKEQLISAAEKALLHSDKDYQISHRADGFSASRRWSSFLVITALEGFDSWNVQVSGKNVKIVAWYAGGSYFAAPGTHATPSKSIEEYYLSPPLYNLFFERMEYFLALRSDWAPCTKLNKTQYYFDAGLESGNDPLCSHVRAQDPTKK